MKNGLQLIEDERHRQIYQERWSDEHDDSHDWGQLAYASLGYVNLAAVQSDYSVQMEVPGSQMLPHPKWPFEKSWWKPSDDPIRNLVKAGALIAAEIDRLQRKNGVATAFEVSPGDDIARLNWLERTKTSIGYNVECCAWGVDFDGPFAKTVREAIDRGREFLKAENQP